MNNEQIIRRAYELAEKVDVKGWVECFTSDWTFTDMSTSVTYRGPDGPAGLGKTVEAYAKAFPNIHRELYRFFGRRWRVLKKGVAAPQGFEPRYAAPEAAVLPLNEGAVRTDHASPVKGPHVNSIVCRGERQHARRMVGCLFWAGTTEVLKFGDEENFRALK